MAVYTVVEYPGLGARKLSIHSSREEAVEAVYGHFLSLDIGEDAVTWHGWEATASSPGGDVVLVIVERDPAIVPGSTSVL